MGYTYTKCVKQNSMWLCKKKFRIVWEKEKQQKLSFENNLYISFYNTCVWTLTNHKAWLSAIRVREPGVAKPGKCQVPQAERGSLKTTDRQNWQRYFP